MSQGNSSTIGFAAQQFLGAISPGVTMFFRGIYCHVSPMVRDSRHTSTSKNVVIRVQTQHFNIWLSNNATFLASSLFGCGNNVFVYSDSTVNLTQQSRKERMGPPDKIATLIITVATAFPSTTSKGKTTKAHWRVDWLGKISAEIVAFLARDTCRTTLPSSYSGCIKLRVAAQQPQWHCTRCIVAAFYGIVAKRAIAACASIPIFTRLPII